MNLSAGGGIRGWDLLKRLVLEENDGKVPATTPPAPPRPATPEASIRQDLVLASRMLASIDLGVLDLPATSASGVRAIPTAI